MPRMARIWKKKKENKKFFLLSPCLKKIENKKTRTQTRTHTNERTHAHTWIDSRMHALPQELFPAACTACTQTHYTHKNTHAGKHKHALLKTRTRTHHTRITQQIITAISFKFFHQSFLRSVVAPLFIWKESTWERMESRVSAYTFSYTCILLASTHEKLIFLHFFYTLAHKHARKQEYMHQCSIICTHRQLYAADR